MCAHISFPVSHHKTVGPSHTLTFLGIEIDTRAGTMSLPPDKLHQLQTLLTTWQDRKAAPKRDLLSLLGHLSHASTVVRSGRIFVRHLIEAAKHATAPHHYVRLNQHCRADLSWWLEFGRSWNGTSLWTPSPPALSCFSDASGSWGCAAILSTTPHQWFQLEWPASWQDTNIAAKEMLPVTVAAAIWGHSWSGKRILFRSDNTATVAAIQSGLFRDPSLRHLLRCLFFFAASWHFEYTSTHIPGSENAVADALSRDKAYILPQLAPSANLLPSSVPLSLQVLLFDTATAWTSPTWLESFRLYMDAVSPTTQKGHTIRQHAAT